MLHDFSFYIDIVDRCNLRCPSCPRGNSSHIKQHKGRMSPELLDRIMRKATGECNIRDVHLYNWTEPFLHPGLSEMIEIVHSYNLSCGLSSNLNILPNIDDVMAANPEYLLISTSGFTQSAYGRTHRGGDVERVKKNMASLAESKRQMNSGTRIEVKYLVYLGNLDEAALMKEYAESLGFSFLLSYAGLMPLEKLVAYLTNGQSGEPLTEEDLQLVERLVFPHREVVKLAGPYKKLTCPMLEEWIMINCLGNVQLCCMVYDENRYTIADFLSTPLSEIQRLKKKHFQCRECFDLGIAAARNYHIFGLNKFIFEKVARYFADIGLDVKKVQNQGRFLSWIMRSYQVLRLRAAKNPWLHNQYRRLRKNRQSIFPHHPSQS